MEYLRKLQGVLHFKFCTCFYLTFAMVMLVNEMYLGQRILALFCRIVLYIILFYKGIKILHRYYKAAKENTLATDKKEFGIKYRGFRIQVSLWWIAFAVLCGIVKYVCELGYNYYFCLSFVLLAVDIIFVNTLCLLQYFSDPKAKVVKCCCGCPVRGWDLLMINTPLLFAYNTQTIGENIFTICALILAVLSFICWEHSKYHLVEIREKCKKSCELRLCIENQVK